MQEILVKLHRDHINFAELLKFFEKQLISIRCGSSPDCALLLSALEYLSEYQDTIHHPAEDVIYRTYVKRHDDTREVIEGLILEHKALKFLSAKLGEIMRHIVQGNLDNIRGLEIQLNEFVQRQKDHIDCEETTIFQIMNQALTEDEWEHLKPQFLAMDDPLFGRQTKPRYQKLRAFMGNMA